MAYIITRINKRHRLVLVELIEFREMKTKVLCKRLDNNEIVEKRLEVKKTCSYVVKSVT